MTSRPPKEPLPDSLGAPLEKLVYLYIRESGGASIYDLRDALDVPQLRLYPIIRSLVKRELVERHGDEVWPAEEPVAPRIEVAG